MKYIKENNGKFRAYVIGESVDHCKWIEKLGEWRRTQAEIFAVTTLLKIQN